MRFKSPTDTPVQVVLLSGHCAVIGNEWRELPPILHQEAFRKGCISDNMSESDIAARVESATPGRSNHDILVDAIRAMMDAPEPGDVTAADLPNLKKLSARVGWSVNREEMMQAMLTIQAE